MLLGRFGPGAGIVGLLVERVDITGEGASIRLRTEGLASLVRELRAQAGEMDAGSPVQPTIAILGERKQAA